MYDLHGFRILFVNFHHDNHTITNDLGSENYPLLYFSFSNKNKNNTDGTNECTYFSWNDVSKLFIRYCCLIIIIMENLNFKNYQANWGNIEYVTIWLKIILPISYQFNPEITVILLNLEYFSEKGDVYIQQKPLNNGHRRTGVNVRLMEVSTLMGVLALKV